MKTECVKTICPVCGPASTSFVGECHDYPVVKCDECSLMFVGECESVDQTEDFFLQTTTSKIDVVFSRFFGIPNVFRSKEVFGLVNRYTFADEHQ